MKNLKLFFFSLLSVLCYMFFFSSAPAEAVKKPGTEQTAFFQPVTNTDVSVSAFPVPDTVAVVIHNHYNDTSVASVQPDKMNAIRSKRKRFLAGLFYKDTLNNYFRNRYNFNQATAGNISAICYRRL